MSGPRVDYHSDMQPLQRLGAALLLVGCIVAWALAIGLPWWLRSLGALVLLACGLGLFVVSARWFTREYPVLTLHADRIAYRGLRERVVMLRNLAGAQIIERRRFGVTLPWLELEMRDDDEIVRWPLWALQVVPDALLEAIAARVRALERDRLPG